MISTSEIEQARQDILTAGVWELGEYVFAGNNEANNKLEMERLLNQPEKAELVLNLLGGLAIGSSFYPDAIWGVPNGGQEFAKVLGKRLKVPVVLLAKDKVNSSPGEKRFKFRSDEDEAIVDAAQNMVAVEDVTTKLTSLDGALQNPKLAKKTNYIVAIWRRGTEVIERKLYVPILWIIEEPLPNIITPDHPFYQRYHDLAVRQAA